MAVETTEVIQREIPEVEAYKLGLLESAKGLSDQPITLPQQQIAGFSGLQQQAFDLAQQGIGGYQPFMREAGFSLGDSGAQLRAVPGQATPYITGSYGQATNLYQQAAGAPSAEMIQGYMNPYQDAVQAEINRAYDIQGQQGASQAVGAGAFGGGRAEIAQQEINRNRGQALAQAQAQNFLQAQQAAQNQMGRQLQAAQGIGSLGLQAGQTLGQLGLQTGEALGTLGLRQASLGEMGQKLGQQEAQFAFGLGKEQQLQQQAGLEAQRQSDLAQLYEPYQRLSFLSDIYKGAPSSQQTISAATAPSVSPAQQYLGLGIAGLSAASGANKAGLFG